MRRNAAKVVVKLKSARSVLITIYSKRLKFLPIMKQKKERILELKNPNYQRKHAIFMVTPLESLQQSHSRQFMIDS
jgi:hypothetical protein